MTILKIVCNLKLVYNFRLCTQFKYFYMYYVPRFICLSCWLCLRSEILSKGIICKYFPFFTIHCHFLHSFLLMQNVYKYNTMNTIVWLWLLTFFSWKCIETAVIYVHTVYMLLFPQMKLCLFSFIYTLVKLPI